MKPSNVSEGNPHSEAHGSRLIVWRSVLLLALAGALSCGGKIPPTFYYQLHLPEPAVQPPGPPLEAKAVVIPFDASAMLTQDRIVYRPSREQVGFYEYHRWAEDPRTTITHALLRHLRTRNTFEQITLYDGRTNSDYTIRGRIDRLEEVDFEAGVTVRVSLSAKLVETESGDLLWQDSAADTATVAVDEVRDVVAKMSDATDSAVRKLAAELDTYLRERESERAAADPPRPPTGQR